MAQSLRNTYHEAVVFKEIVMRYHPFLVIHFSLKKRTKTVENFVEFQKRATG